MGNQRQESPLITHRFFTMRRIVYAVLLVIWLLMSAFPFFAFALAGKGELSAGDPNGRYLRIFLLQEIGTEGIGVEWTRPSSAANQCSQTNVNYFMWDGEADNSVFCQCFDKLSGSNASLGATAGACP